MIENDYRRIFFNINKSDEEINKEINLFQISSLKQETKVPNLMKNIPKKNLNIENQKLKILEQLMKKNFSKVYKTKINKI